ncbi:zinc-ribbon domain-containing protein [Limosilactobacillus reuteri]|uniref:zinc ribbon domain-containing protein n=1 Tax=Limosilactobacillus reuteri TaxID=1598 RepID=UPI003D78491B
MKFCPNCGNKLQPGDKFCEKCGYNLTQDSQNDLDKGDIKKTANKAKEQLGKQAKKTTTKIQDKLKNIDTSWFKQGNHKWYTVGAILVLLFLILFVGHIRNNGGSLVAPRNITFSKMNGTRVWLSTEGGKGKDAIVDYIDVTKNGKFIQYQIFDDNITLGKASKMSNSQLIKLGKEQDKKYFDESINEVKAYRDGKGQIGLQNDLTQDHDLKQELKLGEEVFYSYNGNVSHMKDIKFISESEYNRLKDKENKGIYVGLNYPTNLLPDNSDNAKFEKRQYNALIKNMQKVKYLAPEWQKVKVKNSTDDSGNKITSQKISYDSIDEFNDSGTFNKNVMNLSTSQKERLANLIALSTEEFSVGKFKESESVSNMKQHHIVKLANNVLDDSYYEVITKDFFKPNRFKDDMTLSDPTSQTIYNSRYIGYQIGDDNYLLTKAQNNKQNAVFPKPSN